MNRHQSNPFLAGWETEMTDESDRNGAIEIDQSKIIVDPSNGGATRRRSTSQADTSENPFGVQRNSNDRRLYHRNMSSFDAASLQLERQQMRENGTDSEITNQTDLIAKMTAEFQSAIETNDKQFAVEGTLGDVNLLIGNPFDPFETIVDDDVSLHSLAPNASPRFKNELLDRESKLEVDEGAEHSFDQKVQNTHDSIDDDDDELVSTPVRNIKSSQKMIGDATSESTNQFAHVSLDQEVAFEGDIDSITVEKELKQLNIAANTNSMEKASLFASLLATAESSTQQTSSKETNSLTTAEATSSIGERDIERATHIIKGSSLNKDGNLERPVGFFDPFETVIDKDALTSLMQETSQLSHESNKESGLILNSSLPQTPQSTPLHKIARDQLHQNQEDGTDLAAISDFSEQTLETTSNTIEIQDINLALISSEQSNFNNSISKSKDRSEFTLPTKTQPLNFEEAKQSKDYSSSSNSRKQIKQKKKSSSEEESSDASEEENRIQIVIKAPAPNLAEPAVDSNLVPLLPPPPSKSSMKQARKRGQMQDMPSPIMSYKSRVEQKDTELKADSFDDSDTDAASKSKDQQSKYNISPTGREAESYDEEENRHDDEGQFVIRMSHSMDDEDTYGKPETPLYDEDTSYVLEEFPSRYEGPGWDMMLRYPPKKKLTSNRFWKKIFVKLALVPVAPDSKSKQSPHEETPQSCIALQIFDKPDDRKPMQEIPIQATYTVSEISSQQFDQFGKIFTIKLQYIFYKERVGVRQGQIARFIHSSHIGSSTTSGGHGVDPISIGAIKRVGAPIEHSPQISQIIKLGCTSFDDIKQFKNCLEDYLFKMPIHRDRALSSYKTEEVQMAVRDETYIELNQVGTIIRQLARVRLFFLSFLNGTPTVEVGINAMERQGKEVVGRMDILPVVTEEWIRLEAWELHSTVKKEQFEDTESRIISLIPPDATFFELMRFRVRPPRNRELPLQVSADMTVTRTKVIINCEVMVPGCVSRKHGQIPCENIAIRIYIPECWIYFFREEKHFRMGSKKSVNRRPGKVKGIERFLGGGGIQDHNDESSLIEVTSGQAKYEHHHHAIVWRAARWPKESQSAYVQNTMKIRLPLTAYDKMPESFYEYLYVEYTMPATTVSHTTLRSISVNPCEEEPPEKYVKYSAKYEYRVKLRQSINLGLKTNETHTEASPIVIMKQPDLQGHLQQEEDSDDESEEGGATGDQG